MRIEPDPGTQGALDRGCLCPVIDNCHGQFPPFRDDDGKPQWWITEGCPLHDARVHTDG